MALDAEQWPEPLRGRAYGRGLVALSAGVFGGPVIWFADQQVAYWLVYHACHTNNMVPLYLETLVAMALCVVPFLISWRMLHRLPEAYRNGGQTDDRARFMAISGLGLSIMFFIVLVAAAVPRLILTPCP